MKWFEDLPDAVQVLLFTPLLIIIGGGALILMVYIAKHVL